MSHIAQDKLLDHIDAGRVGLGPGHRYTLTISATKPAVDVDDQVYDLDDAGLVILDGQSVRLSRAGADLRAADRKAKDTNRTGRRPAIPMPQFQAA